MAKIEIHVPDIGDFSNIPVIEIAVAPGDTVQAEDPDGDDVGGSCDNCAFVANSDQSDVDLDGLGDVCDNCALDFNIRQEDDDADGTGNVCDDCTDTDGEGFVNPGFGNTACADDNCPDDANADQADNDGDGLGNVCDDETCDGPHESHGRFPLPPGLPFSREPNEKNMRWLCSSMSSRSSNTR